jgi:short chain dehydrogenase
MNNKVALVTGGTSGIGKEIVKELHRDKIVDILKMRGNI